MDPVRYWHALRFHLQLGKKRGNLVIIAPLSEAPGDESIIGEEPIFWSRGFHLQNLPESV